MRNSFLSALLGWDQRPSRDKDVWRTIANLFAVDCAGIFPLFNCLLVNFLGDKLSVIIGLCPEVVKSRELLALKNENRSIWSKVV